MISITYLNHMKSLIHVGFISTFDNWANRSIQCTDESPKVRASQWLRKKFKTPLFPSSYPQENVAFYMKRGRGWEGKKKKFYSFMGRKNTSIPEDDNKLSVQALQEVFMLHDLQHPGQFNSHSIK